MSALRAEEAGEGEGRAGAPCSGLRKELLDCLRGSECVNVVGVCLLVSWKPIIL